VDKKHIFWLMGLLIGFLAKFWCKKAENGLVGENAFFWIEKMHF